VDNFLTKVLVLRLTSRNLRLIGKKSEKTYEHAKSSKIETE